MPSNEGDLTAPTPDPEDGCWCPGVTALCWGLNGSLGALVALPSPTIGGFRFFICKKRGLKGMIFMILSNLKKVLIPDYLLMQQLTLGA